MTDVRVRFESTVLPHLDAAYRLARWLSSSATDADDIVQDAVLRAFRGFDQLRGPDAKAWLLTIVRNCHRTMQQQKRRHPVEPLTEDGEGRTDPALVSGEPGPEDQVVAADEWRALGTIVLELPEDFREVLVLREVEDMSYREIAQVIGIPIGTVMSRLARARGLLRDRQGRLAEGMNHAVP